MNLPTLDEFEKYIPQLAEKNEAVSRWSVGMQIEHCLLATKGICDAVVNSEPYRGRVKKYFIRRMVFLTGWIPRGRGQSPDAALPNEQISEAGLNDLLAAANRAAETALKVDKDRFWEHEFFGVMKKDDALKFIEIHNRHHLKIIKDILKQTG